MKAAVTQAVMALAISCLGDHRREWGLAMQAEFQAAREDGKPLNFAGGCLLAALRELPTHEEGRFLLASNALAVGFLVPTSALLMSSLIAGFPFSELEQIAPAGGTLLSEANLCAIPPLAAMIAWIAAAQLRLAWLVLERDWARVAEAGTLIAASIMALFIFAAVVFLHYASVLLLAASLGIQLAGVSALARWHRRSFGDP
jgi:hypothetical protein